MENEEPYIIPEGTYPGVHLIEDIYRKGPLPWSRVLAGVFGFWPWFAVTYKLWFAALAVLGAVVGLLAYSGGEEHLFWSTVVAGLLFPPLIIGLATVPLNVHRAVTKASS